MAGAIPKYGYGGHVPEPEVDAAVSCAIEAWEAHDGLRDVVAEVRRLSAAQHGTDMDAPA
jgi:hypothetical protein